MLNTKAQRARICLPCLCPDFSWRFVMGLILLEALGALLLLVLIVWWTMFSGRKKGELPRDKDQP
jgi:hypothetical protein